MQITSSDLLSVGDKVQVHDMRGEIIKAELVNATPSGKIGLHTIKLTTKRTGNKYHGYNWIDIDPIIEQFNYAAINLLKD